MSIAVVERSGSPAVTNGMSARRCSFRRREKRLSIRFMGDLSNRFPAQPGDFVGVLVTSAGEADGQDFGGSEAPGLLEGLGQGVARVEGGENPLVAGGDVVGVGGSAAVVVVVADAAE